ncbi:conserved hypothetical protein [Brucella sp. NVSL 07-0026]|nr:conserved hypothetical protein [Brucella sp. NVSL 07-0026]
MPGSQMLPGIFVVSRGKFEGGETMSRKCCVAHNICV